MLPYAGRCLPYCRQQVSNNACFFRKCMHHKEVGILVLLKEVGSARLRECYIHPISPKTPAPQYQPMDRKKRKGTIVVGALRTDGACTWVYKQANFSQKSLSPLLLYSLQLFLSSLHFTTACCPGPGFAEEELFLLEVPCSVDRCCSCTALLVFTKRTAAICFSWSSHAQSTAAVPVPPCSCPPRGPQLFLGGVKTTALERAH